jgi:hypothetical protein
MKLYHFLTTENAISDLALKRIKVSRLKQLNDPFELLAVDTLNPLDKAALEAFKTRMNDAYGIICFSNDWNNPLLWGHYARAHTGIALGFEISDDLLIKVNYTNERAKIQFDPNSRTVVDGQKTINRLLSTKFKDWSYENESRVFTDLDPNSKEGENYFSYFSEKIKLEDIVLGMECPLSISHVKRFVSDTYEGKVRVLKAGMHRRLFKIIENRAARTI